MRVTKTTKGDNVKPMFGFISEMVMPEMCIFATVLAIACAGAWQSSRLDLMAYGQSSLDFVGVFLSVKFFGFLAVCFALFRLEPSLLTFKMKCTPMGGIQIPLVGFFSFLGLRIRSTLGLTFSTVNVSLISGMGKFLCSLTKSFSRYLATTAVFGYDVLRHVSIPFQLIRVRANLQHKLRLARFIPDHHTGFSITSNDLGDL